MLRLILTMFGIILVIGALLSGSFLYDAYFIQPDDDAEHVRVLIEPGSSVGRIANQLKEEGIISSDWFFKVFVALQGDEASLQAGDFGLVAGSNFLDVYTTLNDAKANEVQITIPEGFTASQIGETVVEAIDGIGEDEWNDISGENGKWKIDSPEVLTGIPKGHGLEGYLFPDTYRFREDVSAEALAETMILTLKRRLSEKEIALPENGVFENGMTFHEVMTLASIIQREVRSIEDMKIVSGIFHTRMKIGMALQADSTVNYVTGKKTAAISLDDSRLEHPYNTYKNLGLPPGPISNPGIDAIYAALYPEDSDYLYFLTTPEGDVKYAQTFNQHIDNKHKFLP